MALNNAYPPWKGYALAFVGSLLVGGFPIAFRELLLQVKSPVSASGMLLFCALVMSAPFALVDLTKNSNKKNKPRIYCYCLILAMVFAGTLGNLTVAISLEELLPATVQFLQRFEIIAVVILGVIFLQERPSVRLFIAVALALFGVFLVYQTKFVYQYWYSLILPMFSGFLFAVINIAAKKLIIYYSPLTLNFFRLTITVFILSLLPGSFWGNHLVDTYAWLLAIGAACTGPMGARILYTYSFYYIPVGHSILFTTLSPIATLAIQWIWLKRFPDMYEFIGGLVIIGAIIYLLIPEIRTAGKKKKIIHPLG